MERHLDHLVYGKYTCTARLQALSKASSLSDARMEEVADEDKRLLEYIEFIKAKTAEYEVSIEGLKTEVQRNQKRNEKLA